MKSCEFANELNRLRKSSSDSIDNVDQFDEFKRYMHITRPVEEDLKSTLREVNESGVKTLLMLCGSAGDGKSHLLSYLKNSDSERLLENYIVHNDATESDSPKTTAIETLDKLLSGFKDKNLNEPGKNIILAINLGVLSNFIESEYGKEYRVLKNYVADHKIMSMQVNRNECDEHPNFRHVSFSDYHMYKLKTDGAYADYLEEILDKVFGEDEKNIFLKAYGHNCAKCSLAKNCPVKKNYEFMMDKGRQRFVANLLVKVAIQDKMILTTREVLNFIYDIIVAQNFNKEKLCEISNDAILKEFMSQITPALLFDFDDVSILMNKLKKFDPLLDRSEEADEDATSYYLCQDISKKISAVFEKVTYKDVICNIGMIERVNDNKTLKAYLYKLIVRMKAIDEGVHNNKIYDDFLLNLYWYNAGEKKKLGSLYTMVEDGVTQWCGSDLDGNLCLEDKHRGFAIFEKINWTPQLDHIPAPIEGKELQRFVPSIKIGITASERKTIYLEIDYALYELIYKLSQGYVQTVDDRNNYADFISFVNQILQAGSLSENIFVLTDGGRRASISQDTFGYKFKVVR